MKTTFILIIPLLTFSLDAAEGNPRALAPALTAEQKSYQALLRLQAHEFEVSRQSQNQSRSCDGGCHAQHFACW